MKTSIFSSEKQVFQFLKLWSKPKGGPHALHTMVPPLVHVKIFTRQNLSPNHPILNETVSFHENNHFFILKTSFSIFEFVVKTKGGTTCIAYCGPPLVHVKIFMHQNLSPNQPILSGVASPPI